MYNQQNNLPVSTQQIDQNTISNNLPHGNDRYPTVNLSPLMQQNQQCASLAIGTFRLVAQNTIQKSQFHVFAYNLISSNGFQNQIWNLWAGHVLEFVEYLMVNRQYQAQTAIERASQRIYECFLGKVFESYQQALVNSNIVTQQMFQGLQTAISLYGTIMNDIQNARNNQGQSQLGQQNHFVQQQQQNVSGNLPPIGANTINVSYQANGFNNQASFQTAQSTNVINNPLYDNVMAPVEEVSSMNSQYIDPYMETTPIEENLTDETIPTSIDDVIVDPNYHQPVGSKLDFRRPYDVINNPGGIIIYPAHQKPDLKRTIGDDAPYSIMVDPEEFCLFYVVFPDGSVKEKFVEWNPQMEYLKHELDDNLKLRYMKADGKVVASKTKFSNVLSTPVVIPEAEDKDDLMVEGGMIPVILEDVLLACESDLDAELNARTYLINKLQLDEGDEIPAHEYENLRINYMDIDEELYAKLGDVRDEKDLTQVPFTLRALVDSGELSLRYYNYINSRLTDFTNKFLQNGLSLGITIEDYGRNIGELVTYLKEKRGEKYSKLFCEYGPHEILKRAVNVMGEGKNVGIADYFINIQTGWTLAEMSTLNITKEKAVLVSSSTNQGLKDILISAIARANKKDFITSIRLITVDGYYMEVIRGRLVDKAVLLKRLN